MTLISFVNLILDINNLTLISVFLPLPSRNLYREIYLAVFNTMSKLYQIKYGLLYNTRDELSFSHWMQHFAA